MSNPRLYFGRMPERGVSVDQMFINILSRYDWLIDSAVDDLVQKLQAAPEVVFHTMNPLIPNYMLDKVAVELMWMIDEEGNHISMKDDMHLRSKLDWMAPGEALCDDARSFKSLPVEPQESVNK